jgi:hypothetical protein
MRNIRQNLFLSFAYNVAGIPLAAGVLYPFFGLLLPPVVTAVAMALSSVSVITNVLRLRTVKAGLRKCSVQFASCRAGRIPRQRVRCWNGCYANSFWAMVATCRPWYCAMPSSCSLGWRSPWPPAIVEAP